MCWLRARGQCGGRCVGIVLVPDFEQRAHDQVLLDKVLLEPTGGRLKQIGPMPAALETEC